MKSKYEKEKKRSEMVIKDLNDKIQRMKDQPENSKKQTHQSNSDSESDIFEGLSESKKERIMSEVAELYEANIALQLENNMLK